MDSVNTLVLPGLDGTDSLLARFQQLAPSTHRVRVLALCDDPSFGYSELCDHYSKIIESSGRYTLVGESFSGPLAILLAHRHPQSISHLVLVATFATTPIPRFASLLPWSLVFRFPMPRFVARRYLVGSNKELISQLRTAVRSHSPQTLARRMRELSRVNVTSEVKKLDCPITYLRPSNDRLVSNQHAQAICQLIQRVKIRQIDGPHLILQSQPELAWQHIVETAPTPPF